jgi:tRNA dimethylallyltransferase
LHERLRAVDPPSAAKLHPNDLRRIIRALEVYQVMGRPLSRLQSQSDEGRLAEPCRVFALSWPRQILRRRIDARVQWMFAAGLVDEVRRLLQRHGRLSRTAAQAVGYREVIEHLAGRRELADTIASVQSRTHRFARRQETWFRSLSECRRIPLSGGVSPGDVAQQILAAEAPGLRPGL